MREIGETRMLEPFAPSFASWNVLADRYSRRQNVEDKKEKYANVCDIVFGILDEKSVVGAGLAVCVLQCGIQQCGISFSCSSQFLVLSSQFLVLSS